MDIKSILSPARTHCALTAASKKKAIEEAARHIAAALEGVSADSIYESLISREKLGTTAIGHGVAIPHCRVQHCETIIGSLFRLEEPVDFDAFDDEPVQLLFVLLVPADEVDEHLQALAMLAKRFDSETYRHRLLGARNDDDLYAQAIAGVDDAGSTSEEA